MLQPQGKSIAVDHAIEKAHESSLEAASRQEADFPSVENKLNLQRFSTAELGIIDKLTGLLGEHNPFGSKATAKENEVWLLDNAAYKPTKSTDADGGWEAEFVACFFQKGRKDITEFVSRIADAIGLDGEAGENEEVRKRIAERVQPFVSAISPARSIAITSTPEGQTGHDLVLGPSNSNGISSQIFPAGDKSLHNGSVVTYRNDGSEYPRCSGTTRFAGPEGWAIISDIDDTIKITQSSNPIGILQTTFAEQPRTTEGMESFYQTLDRKFQNPAWFYVSASPYNLYPFLHDFINQYYLPGTLILRDASWMFFGGLLQSLTQGVQEYKTSRITKIHGWLPQRKVICIGDSTQKDPETYAEMYKKYPGWIQAIYIRKVTDIPFMDIKNRDKRFEDAFKHVPSQIWQLFTTPDELTAHVDQLITDAGVHPSEHA